MGQELGTQGQLLDDLGYEMDVTQTRLAAAQKKVQYVLEKAGSRGQLIIIAVLVVVLVVLIFLAIS
jgi:syntaxin 6